jgi:eukaryotic-like serine/threonine-protein kinase
VKGLVAEALDRTAGERAAFLHTSCGRDEELRREVESLLAAHAAAENRGFLDGQAALDPPEAVAPVGRRIGAYEVVGELGRGGMGLVLKAVRADDAYRKTVALKVVPSAGISEPARLRFLEERQILASLEHPHIARLLDGGTTEEGLPYLVMELVEGEPIDRYCDGRQLGVEARLRLFLSVVEAVQHAHRNLVVHRDIKPANVLMTADGAPKLLDFGIARLLSPGPVAAATEATVTAFRMLTPEYASPEQVRGEPLTTATDVYSLGVLLYVLLTGRSPHGSPGAPAHEVLAAVCAREPERPSAAVAGTPREGWRRRLAGDLDTIVLKALRKEAGQRYTSAEAFAEDLRRHLSAQPVRARRPTLSYRARKFVRRNPAAVASAALAVLALAGGIAATARENRRTNEQRQKAERRFADVRRLANTFLFEVHDAVAPLAGSTAVRELLVKRGLEYLDSLSSEAAGDRSLQVELGRAYKRVGDVQGGAFMANLGDVPGAMASYKKALALLEAAGAAEGPGQADLADALRALASVQIFRGEAAEARRNAERALALSRQEAPGLDPRARRSHIAHALFAVGFVAYHQGDRAASESALNEQTQLAEELHAEDPADRALTQLLGSGHWALAGTLWTRQQLASALKHFERARELQEGLAQAMPENALVRRQLAYTYESIGNMLSTSGEPARAVPALERALALRRELAGLDARNVDARVNLTAAEKSLALGLVLAKRPAEALTHLDAAIRSAEEGLAADPRNVRLREQLAESYGVHSMALDARLAAAGSGPRLQVRQEQRRWLARAKEVYLALQSEGALRAPSRNTLRNVEEADARYAREIETLQGRGAPRP